MAHEEIIINGSLRLVQLLPDQADRLFELTEKNREYLGEFLPWVPHVKTVEDSRKHIQETLLNREVNKVFTYGIEQDGTVIGDISIRNLQDATLPPEIGYWLGKEYAGRGITTLATQALSQFGVDTLGLKKIIIKADPDNVASNKVAEKAGFMFEHQEESENHETLNVWVINNEN